MKKTLLELQRELDDTENIIRACDTAQVYGLTLDSASFDKYNEATEKQKELLKEISAYEQMRGGIITHTQMMRKEPELRVDECKVEDVVELPPAVFDDFTHSMLEDYDFIAERKDCMYNDSSYLSHCILVLCEGREDGVLVESEGSSYARYSGFLPNARTFMNGQIQKMADRIVHDGMPEQGSVLSEFTFEELSKQLNTQISWDSYIGQNLIDRLIDNGSVRNFSQTDDGISFEIIADEIEERQKPFTVRDLMRANLEDIHLLDTDVEHDLATIVELNEHTLTEEGVTAWSDVLNARVKRVYAGYYGTQVDVEGCDPNRLEAFSKMLAGECTLDEMDRWVNPSEDGETFNLKFDDGGSV